MNFRYASEIEARLQELGAKRHTLEKKSQMRLKTLAEFEVINGQSQRRLVAATEEQNQRARERNAHLLDECNRPLHDKIAKKQGSADRELERLSMAKTKYREKLDAMLPVYHRHVRLSYEEKIQ